MFFFFSFGDLLLELYGLKLLTSKGVYEPSEDSFLAIEALSKVISEIGQGRHNVSVLDMGCGTGIIGLYAAKSEKVGNVLLVDKNEEAVSIARRNIILNNLESKAKALQSDLFSSVSGVFEILVFNAPYLREEEGEPKEEAEMLSGGKEGVELSLRFLEEAREHLDKKSSLILTSSASNLELLEKGISNLGYALSGKISKSFFMEEIYAFILSSKRQGPRI